MSLAAAEVLGTIGDHRAKVALGERAVSQGRPRLRTAALRSCFRDVGVEALAALLDDDELVLRCTALEALGKVGGESAGDAVVDLVAAVVDDEGAQGPEAPVTVHLRPSSLVHWSASDLVADGTLRDHVAVLACAAEALGRVRHPRSLRPLLGLLSHAHPAVRAYAARALGSLGDPAALARLVARLTDEVAGVRACAARALGGLGDQSAVDAVVGLLADANSDVKASAVQALGALGDPRAVEPLVAILRQDRSSGLPARGRLANKEWAAAAKALVDIARGPEGTSATGAILRQWPVLGAPAEANVVLYDVLAQLGPQLHAHAGDAGWARTCASLAVPTAFVLALGLLASPDAHERLRGAEMARTVLASPEGGALGAGYFYGVGREERVKELAKEANDALGRGDPDAALRACQEILELDPDNRFAWSGMGHAYEGQRRYDEAVETFRRAVERFPEDASLWMLLGLAYVDQGRADQAVGPYLRAIELDPEESFFHERLGDAYRWRGRYDEAVASFERVLEMDGPLNTGLFAGLCNAYLGAGRPEEAATAARRGLELFPNHVPTLVVLADALAEADDQAGAVEVLRQVLSLEPGHAVAANRLATLSFQLGEFTEARAVLEDALAAADAAGSLEGGLLGVILANLAAVLEHQGELVAARDAAERGLAVVEAGYGPQHPFVAQLGSQLGGLLFRLGEPAAARTHLERALAIDEVVYVRGPGAAIADLENLAAVLVALGEGDEAARALQRALAIVETTEGRESARAAEIAERLSALP